MITIHLMTDEVHVGLSRLAAGLADLTPVMQDIGEEMVVSTRERFLAGVSPEGAAWVPKSQATIDNYHRRGDQIDLRPLFGPSLSLSSQIAWLASADQVEWGSSRIYSAVMQFGAAKGAFGTDAGGSPIPWGNIPARPFLGLSTEDRQAVVFLIEDWLTRAWDRE